MLSLCDVHSLSEFQREAQTFLEKFQETKVPIVLTVNGKATVVVQDADVYQQLLDRIELLESVVGIQKSIEEFESGKGQPLKQAFEQLQVKYGLPD